MAKGLRSKIKKKHRATHRERYEPTVTAQQETRAVRMSAYIARSQARKLATENKEVPATLATAASHADALDTVDDQARDLTKAGRFFFAHPNSKLAAGAAAATAAAIESEAAVPVYTGPETVCALNEVAYEAKEIVDSGELGTELLPKKRARLVVLAEKRNNVLRKAIKIQTDKMKEAGK